jgi:TetR/AcrR family transcriptional regulator, tetracycline repressor protein
MVDNARRRNPEHKRGRRRPGERAGLDLPRVLGAARTLAEAEGLEEVTMRRLAERLGVAPNALYSYFADKNALLDGLIDQVLGEIQLPVVERDDWREALAELMRRSRRLLLARSALMPALLARPTRGPNALRLGEATLALLARGGITGQAAVDGLRILLIYTLGFVAQESPRRSDAHPAKRIARSESAFASVDDGPHLRALARPMARHADDATFEKGLAWLLAGITGA